MEEWKKLGTLCAQCERLFIPKNRHNRYCSKECKNEAEKQKNHDPWLSGHPTNVKGAICEHIAIGFLLKQGFEVAKSVLPYPYDLIAIKDSYVYLVDVKKMRKNTGLNTLEQGRVRTMNISYLFVGERECKWMSQIPRRIGTLDTDPSAASEGILEGG